MKIKKPIVLSFLLLLSSGSSLRAEEILDVTVTAGAKMRMLIAGGLKKPKANLLLLPGGNGVLGISEKGIIRSKKGNFLVRSRDMLAERGYLTALVDAPRNRQDKKGLKGYRVRKNHARDLAILARVLKKRNGRPVIAVGTSRGTISAANIGANNFGHAVDGIILTSSLVRHPKKHLTIQGVDLAKIRVPVLVVHNRQDRCKYTLFKDARKVVESMRTGGVDVALKTVSGGRNSGNPCHGRSRHGFLGLEREVIGLIHRWIRQRF